MAQCLRTLKKDLSGNEKIYNTSINILFNGAEKERNALLSVCLAFHEQPDVLRSHVTHVIENRPIKRSWGTPLHGGQKFYTVPGTRSFMAGYGTSNTTKDLVTASFGDFIDLDGDGYPDYVISFFAPQQDFNPTWDQGFFYRAVYINQGDHWTMNACETNMQSVWKWWLVHPCP
jgi:hypothetical protein